ncbi:MAG: TIGR02677 family protein [Actinomycetales bacterium]|nr:TIGR02677 family protein [Actinomycetales bacterium]
MSQEEQRERALRRDLLRYVTAEVADDYAAIMDLFTANLLVDLSAAEVAERLRTTGVHLSTDDVETRCEQLLAWGNLVPSFRDTRVKTIAEYMRSRARYQPSKLGGMVHRQVTDLMSEVGGVREVARELLGGMVTNLQGIVRAAGEGSPDLDSLAGDVSRLFADHQLFADSVAEFYGHLPTVLSRFDLAGEEYVAFKELLVTYVHLVSADVSRHAPALGSLLGQLELNLGHLLDLLAPTVALQNVDGTAAKRSPGRTEEDWDALVAYYTATGGRAVPDQLRAATDAALNQLLVNAKRMLAAAGTGISRHTDLRRLAQWFAVAGTQDCHRIFDAVFGLYPARHVTVGPEEGDLVPPATSWWVADPVDVPVSLRERGDRAARGRTSSVPDPGLEALRLQDEAAEEAAARSAAGAELMAAGDLHGTRLSPAARDVLLELLADALGTDSVPDEDGAVGVCEAPDLGVTLTVRAQRGDATVCTSVDGVLHVADLRLAVHPLQVRAAEPASLAQAAR